MKNFFMIVCFLLFAGSASAEEIALSNGMTIKGVIIERTDKKIKVHASGMDVTYYIDEIRSIDGKPLVASMPVETRSVKPALPAEPQSVRNISETAESAVIPETDDPSPAEIEEVPSSIETSSAQTLQVRESSNTVQTSSTRNVKSKKMTSAQLISVVMIALSVFGLIFVVACYPVFIIAKKTNTAYPYFAFIPILSYYLLCKISGRPVWWMVLYFVPLVGLVIDVIVWMDIAKVRRKPNWMGALILVPLANLGMMWYLALSDQ